MIVCGGTAGHYHGMETAHGPPGHKLGPRRNGGSGRIFIELNVLKAVVAYVVGGVLGAAFLRRGSVSGAHTDNLPQVRAVTVVSKVMFDMHATREITFFYIGSPMRSCSRSRSLAAPPDLDNPRSYDHWRGAQRSLCRPRWRVRSPPAALRARRRASRLRAPSTLSAWPSTT